MSQKLRPTLDVTVTGWTDHLGGATNLFEQIREIVRNDAEYLQTGLAPTNAIYVAKLSAGVDPASSAGYIARFAYRKDADAGDAQDLTVQIRQGYVSEGSPGTLIKEFALTAITGTDWVAGGGALSGAEADSVTNHNDLYVRVLAP